MAALRSVLNGDECLFFPGSPKDKKKSRAFWVRKIENIPSHFKYEKGILDPNKETLDWIGTSAQSHLLDHKVNLGVKKIEKEDQLFRIVDNKDQIYYANFVILCTGVMDVQPKIQNEIDPIFDYANAQTADYCLICDGHHVRDKRVVVIGHNQSAAWSGIILMEKYQVPELTLLLNGQVPTFDQDASSLLEKYKIKVLSSPILNIEGEERGKILKGFNLESKEFVAADICFVSLGMIVYNELALQLEAQVDERGFVVTNETGETTVSGLYVAGDLRANSKKQIYTAWDQAVTSANAINMKLRQRKRTT